MKKKTTSRRRRSLQMRDSYYSILFFWMAHLLLTRSVPLIQTAEMGVGFFLFFRLLSSEPGNVKETWLFPTCDRCGLARRERSHHCRYCKRCIDGFDHHCDVLDMCVGRGNVTLFRIFLLFHSVFFFHATYLHFFLFVSSSSPAFLFFLFFDSLFFFVFLLFFLLHAGLGFCGVPWYKFMESLVA